jgi:hypothetical protein
MTAISLSGLIRDTKTEFRLPHWVKRFVNAAVASRAEAAEQELRRHHALIRDLGGNGIRLSRSEILPFTV